jgi:AbiTii/TIR domain
MTVSLLDLQREATDQKVPLITLLQHALILATNLQDDQFIAWLRRELNGYHNEDSEPIRMLNGEYMALIGTRTVPIPFSGTDMMRRFITLPISEIEHLLHGSQGHQPFAVRIQIDRDSLKSISLPPEGHIAFCMTAGTVNRLLQAIRTRVLEWTLSRTNQEHSAISPDLLRVTAAHSVQRLLRVISDTLNHPEPTQRKTGVASDIPHRLATMTLRQSVEASRSSTAEAEHAAFPGLLIRLNPALRAAQQAVDQLPADGPGKHLQLLFSELLDHRLYKLESDAAGYAIFLSPVPASLLANLEDSAARLLNRPDAAPASVEVQREQDSSALQPARAPHPKAMSMWTNQPESEMARFDILALELLGIEGLPLPRLDGYEGSAYLTEVEYGRLCTIVCQRVPGVATRDWWEASPSKRIAYMEAALGTIVPDVRPPVSQTASGVDLSAIGEDAKQDTARDKVFISYSHKDARFCEELKTHLRPLERAGRVSTWSDKQIEAGTQWLQEITTALSKTKVAVMLVTKDFLASDFIHEYELGPLLKTAKQSGVRILWVLVRACNWQSTALKDLQALLPTTKPLAQMKADRDQAWVKVCEEITKIAGSAQGIE